MGGWVVSIALSATGTLDCIYVHMLVKFCVVYVRNSPKCETWVRVLENPLSANSTTSGFLICAYKALFSLVFRL